MVFKATIGSSLDVEEEDIYLRKCNVRKSKRQQEKSRRISQQENELFGSDRMLSPVPPPAIKNGGSHSKGKLRTTFVPEPAEPSTPHSTDDPYPSPSPPPRSPSFASPISLSRSSHTLSLCLFTPNGYTISSGNRKTISRESPEMNGISYADPIGRSRSNSNGSWGEYALQNSPQKSPITDFHQSRDSSPRKSPLSSAAGTGTGTDSPIDVSAYQESTDSSRVKQFLFHRDRDRARKAQLLYPSIGGHTADITQDWDDYEYGGGGADHKTPGKRDSPPGSSNRKTTLSRRGSGSSSGARQQRPNLYLHSSRSAGKSPAERSITVDLETDIRASTNGAVFGGHSSERKVPKFLRSPPLTPFVVIPAPPKDTAGGNTADDLYGNSSPYYRALTLGFSSPVAVERGTVLEKNGFTPPYGDAGSNTVATGEKDREPSECANLASPPMSTEKQRLQYHQQAQQRKDSMGSDHSSDTHSSHSSQQSDDQPGTGSSNSSVHSQQVEAYDSLFPALPSSPAGKAGPLRSLSALSLSLTKPQAEAGSTVDEEESVVEVSAEDVSVAGSAAVLSSSDRRPEQPVLPPLYSAHEVGTMLHQALLRAGTHLNYPDGAPLSAATPSKGAVRAMRAWDDADSSDSDEDCSQSDMSSRDDSVASSLSSVLQEQVLKIAEMDATCGSLLQKCDYIYEILKSRYPQRFDADFVRMVSAPHVSGSTVAKSQEHPPLQEVVGRYLRPHLVHSLVQSLQYEDTRFESARIPILHVLYKSSPAMTAATAAATTPTRTSSGRSITTTTSHNGAGNMRVRIAHAIESVAQERFERCARLLSTASRHELDINYISKEGYADLVCAPNLSAIDTIAANCDQNAVIEGENERANFKTKDSEITIIELIKFIIAHEINESLLSLQEAVESPWSPSKTPPHKSATTTYVAQYVQSTTVLTALSRAYCSLFRCYTHKLGAHYAGSSESVEQPVLLEHLCQLLDGLLAWSKILTNLHGQVHTNQQQEGSSTYDIRRGVPSALKDTPLDIVCCTILSSSCKYWTAGLNYGQDVAYLLQSEVVLSIYAPPSGSSATSDSSGAPYASAFRAADNALPALFLLPGKDVAYRVLMKMLNKITSKHTKVATQALQSIQNPVLMVRYFLPRVATAMVSYIFGTEVGRITFLAGAGWDNDRREDCLNILVDRLRECREVHQQRHSCQLQVSSAQLLDTTLELLQVIEDAE